MATRTVIDELKQLIQLTKWRINELEQLHDKVNEQDESLKKVLVCTFKFIF